MSSRKLGQSSVELLVLLSVGFLALTIIFLVSQNEINNTVKLRDQDYITNSVLDLSSAAKQVYSQGIGARKIVHINLPTSYAPENSYVANRTIKITAGGSDYAAGQDFDVTGSLPANSGSSWVWVISEGSRVRIGNQLLSVSPNSIYLILNRNSSTSATLSAQNIWYSNINVTPSLDWANGAYVSATTWPSSQLTINAGSSQNFQLTFTSAYNTSGFYNGDITFNSTDGNSTNDTFLVPISVEVINYGTGIAPPLTVLPSFWNLSMEPGDTATTAFTLCTNTETSLSAVTFGSSIGSPGGWVGQTTPLSAMNPGTCQIKTLNLSVPNGTTAGTYTGYINVLGVGASGASDTISVNVQVGGNPNDHTGPATYNVLQIPSKLYSDSLVTFAATGSDLNLGNSTISGCQINVDSLGWNSMLPSDGDFNQVTEQAYYTYPSGFALGNHIAQFRCTDSWNNVGNITTYNFKVMKNFLFVLKGGSADSTETTWMNWVSSHSSSSGFNWEYDSVPASNVISGLTNVSYYSVIILADYQNGQGLPGPLTNYINSGGRVVFVDASFQLGPRDVGLSPNPGTGGTTSTYIVTDNHYVTDDYSNAQTVNLFSSGGSTNGLKNYIGTQLGTTNSGQSITILADGSGYLVWGATNPANFNSDGLKITTKVFDYSLLESTVQP